MKPKALSRVPILQCMLAASALALASACVEEKTSAEQVLIAQEKAPDPRAYHEEIQKQLEASPSFRSPIRSALIANPGRYQGSTWPTVTTFYDLPEEFRCPVSESVINSAGKFGWELVRCDMAQPIFFRRVREDDNCPRPRLLHYFEVMQVSLRSKRITLENPKQSKHLLLNLIESPRLELEVEEGSKSELVDPFLAKDLDISRSAIGDRNLYRIIDRARDVGVLLRVNDEQSDCVQESSGVIVGDGVVGKVSTPLSTYVHVRKLLDESVAMAAAD
jgi:hypothetical protein